MSDQKVNRLEFLIKSEIEFLEYQAENIKKDPDGFLATSHYSDHRLLILGIVRDLKKILGMSYDDPVS